MIRTPTEGEDQPQLPEPWSSCPPGGDGGASAAAAEPCGSLAEPAGGACAGSTCKSSPAAQPPPHREADTAPATPPSPLSDPRQAEDDDGTTAKHRVSMRVANFAYFVNYFGLSAASPFYGLMLQNIGFSPSQVGYLSAVQPLCTVVLLPPLSYIADRFHCNRTVVMVGILLSSLFLAVASTLSSSLTVSAVVVVLHFLFMTPIDPFLDHHTMSMMPAHQRKEWGATRSYGAYGWGIGAPLAAQLIGVVGWPWMAAQYMVGRVGTAIGFLRSAPFVVPEHTSMKYLQVWGFVVSHRRLALFLACACCMGMGYVLITTFLFLYLRDLGAPEILFGLSITTTVVVEIPLFRHSAWLHDRFTDRQLFAAAAFGWSIRVLGYSLLQNPWTVLLLEPLHGFSFGLMWLSGVHVMGTSFPPHLAASAFGFLHTAAFGIGPTLGNIVGGELYESLGPRGMFRLAAGLMALMAVVFVMVDAHLEVMEQRVVDPAVMAGSVTEDGSSVACDRGVKELQASPKTTRGDH